MIGERWGWGYDWGEIWERIWVCMSMDITMRCGCWGGGNDVGGGMDMVGGGGCVLVVGDKIE